MAKDEAGNFENVDKAVFTIVGLLDANLRVAGLTKTFQS